MGYASYSLGDRTVVKVTIPSTKDFSKENPWVHIAVDMSGSMSGTPIETAWAGVHACDAIYDDRTTLYPFDSQCHTVYGREAVRGCRKNDRGGTYFTPVYTAIAKRIAATVSVHDRHVVIFLSDGDSNDNRTEILKNLGADITVHAIGLGSGVKPATLERLVNEVGKGSYQHCSYYPFFFNICLCFSLFSI